MFTRRKKAVVVSVKDLKDNTIYHVKAIDPNIEAFQSKKTYHNVTATRILGRLTIVRAMPQSGSTEISFLYIVDEAGMNKNINILNDFQFELLIGKELKAAEESYAKKALEDLTNNLRHNFLIGSDPEIFITDKDNVLIPAFNFLPNKTDATNKKHKRMSTMGVEYFNSIYWDGFQAEFDTLATGCLSFHVDSVQAALENLYKLAKKHNPDAKLSVQSTFDIDPKIIEASKDEHVAFGCMPSFNIYGLKGMELSGREVMYRSAGGHIHFGCGKKTEEEIKRIVKALDAILGVACVSLFQGFDNPKRRSMYGLPGEYRTPPHGLEYRVLSNAWLSHPLIMHLVFDLSRKAFMFGQKGLLKYWKATEEETIKCIMNCDVKLSHEILKRNKELLLKIFHAAFRDSSYSDVAYKLFIDGMGSVVKDPHNIIGNWSLESKEWVHHSEKPHASWSKAKHDISKKLKVV